MQVEKLVEQLKKSKKVLDVRKAERALALALTHEPTPVIRGDVAHFFLVHDADKVSLVGDWNGWNHKADLMERINPHSELWYKKLTLPMDGRFAYRLVIDDKETINDPANPYIEREVFGANTVVRMPAYRADRYASLSDEDIPRGRLREFIVPNGYRNQEFARPVRVYTPHNVKRYAALPILYVHDGGEVVSVGKVTTILDNLYHYEPLTPQCVVVLIPPVERNTEYMLNAHYANWIAQTLVPFVEKKLGVRAVAERRGTVGASLGGLLSAQLGFLHPRIFGNIAVQSPSFWFQNETMIKHYAKIKLLPLRWYIHTGTVHDAEVESRKMLALLSEKGYDVTYRETSESHNWANWKNKYAEIIRWFVRAM